MRYAQVVKEREHGQVVALRSNGVWGDAATVEQRVAAARVSTTSTTSFVERANLTVRQPTRRLTRDTNGLSKAVGWLATHLWLGLADDHVV